ncbi:hypothetical protein ABPG72_007261 [Tetrahymena utriculariae]
MKNNLATSTNTVNIDSVIVQNYSRGKQKTSVQSIENDFAVKPILFDLGCTGIDKFQYQNLNINKIDVYQYAIQNALFMLSYSSIQTIIGQITFHQQDQKVLNIWNSNGMFIFQGNSQNNFQLTINGIDIPQINFVSGQNGLMSVSQYASLSISNVNITSLEHFQSYQGSLFTVNNVDNIQITNIAATIYPSCSFKSMFGGLIYIRGSQNINITNLSFNNQNQFSDEVQHQGTQGGILYIYIENQQSKLAIKEINAQGYFTSSADGAFAYISCTSALLQDIFIEDFKSLKNGGAFFIDCEVVMSNVQLLRNKSQFAGGAIFGGQISSAQDVVIKENQSLFGGGIYLANSVSYYQNIKFESNIGLIKGNNVCKHIDEVRIKQFSEYNQYLEPPYQIKNFSLQYSDDEDVYQVNNIYNGLTYFVVLSLHIQDEYDWIEDIENNYVLENEFNNLTPIMLGEDIFNQVSIQSTQTIPLEINEFFYSFSLQYDSSQTQFFAILFPFNTTQQPKQLICMIQANITSNCSNGMIQQAFRGSQYCQYCVDSVVYQNQSKKIPTKCLSCPKDYFESCYADFSSLKQGFWRQNLTVDSQSIFPCSINRFNCEGGNSTGDLLCAEGHIGVECSECDLYNYMGHGSFCRKNIYQCTQCDQISNNIIKIFVLLAIIFIVILIIFKTNFRQQKNYIYKKYLSDMKIIYLGKSYYRLGQSGSYIKILSFYFQIINISSYFYGEQSWANIFNFQYGFYNPVVDSAFSFDCFLAKINESTDSIIYKKMTIVTIAPFCIVFISLIPSLINMFFCKSSKKNFQYSASLIISYGFTNLFCIPVIDVLTSGMLCRTFNNGQSYSILDFNIECNDTDRLVFLFSFVIPFILVYSFVIPGILFYILYKNRENHDKISFRFLLGFLYADFKQEFYYWEYLRFILKLIIIITIYSFLSFSQLIGFVSLAALILYLIFLVRKYPYVTKKLNEMEIKSIVIGSLYMIAYMTNFSLYQQDLVQKQKNKSIGSYNIFSQVLIICANLLSLLFIAFMVGQICISIMQPHLYKLQGYRCYQFVQKYIRVLRFKKYTERKRKNLKKVQTVFKRIVQNSINDIPLQCYISQRSQSYPKESESFDQQQKQKDNDQLLNQLTQQQNSQQSSSDLNQLIQIEEQQQNFELIQQQKVQL